MNFCPNCQLLISDSRYNYCPYCRQVIRELDLICPGTVYAGTLFQVTLTAGGIADINIKSMLLDDVSVDHDSEPINPGSSKVYEVKIDAPGMHSLVVKTEGLEISKSIRCSNLGYFSLRWQNIMELGLNDADDSKKVYVSRELSDKTILANRNTDSWLKIRKISIFVEDKEFNCLPATSGYLIPESFFDYLSKEETCDAEIRVQSIDYHLLVIRNLKFIYDSQLPDIKLTCSDYVNESPLSETRSLIAYALSYRYSDEEAERPVNSLHIKYMSDFVGEQQAISYFDDDQKIHQSVDVNIPKAMGTGTVNEASSVRRLELDAHFEIRGCKEGFCRYFDIPFIIKKRTIDTKRDPNKVVAIDFGTSNTCVAYIDEGNGKQLQQNPTILKFHKFKVTPPHVISYGEDVGEDDIPLTFATNFKPRLHRDEELYYFDRQTPKNIQALKPSALAKLYLYNLEDELFRNADPRPGTALISYPADFPSETRQRVHAIIESLGLISDPDSTLTEPENIALYFALEPGSLIKERIDKTGSATICVFDCGGGTTDVSVVRVSQDGGVSFEILATWGTDRFSGNYITYMVGRSKNGEEAWFPDDFSMLYTAKNDELEQYFHHVQDYEAIKCTSLGEYAQQRHYEDLESSIRTEIRSLFDLINESILYQMFINEVMDQAYADFFILAGNSCRLELFNEEARECFHGSEIIWAPEDGKRAVVLGALKAHELRGSLKIKGASRSKNEYLYRHGLDLVSLFRPMINMHEGADAISRVVNPINIPVLGRHMIDAEDKSLVIKFYVPKPEEIKQGFKYRFKLRFINKTFFFAWIAESGDQVEESDLQQIYTEN